MQCAEMIQEKKLRQGFLLATLVSTVAGTFITGINLYDRLVEQRRQKKLDRGQNKRIKELEQRLNESEAEKTRIKDRERGGNLGNSDLRNSLELGGPLVQREYDRFYKDLGSEFAQGDLIAQTQLQSQIILLQGSLIKLLEEALLTGSTPDINRLYNTAEFAREGSLRALRDQYHRLLQAAPLQRRPVVPVLVRRTSSTPSLRDYSTDSVWSHQKATTQDEDGPLFCRRAEELQRTSRSLESCIAVDRSMAICTACGAVVGEVPDGWKIEKEVAICGGLSTGERRYDARDSDDGAETIVIRTYLLTRRFIFKCHREGSGYACYLCFCHRDRDTLFRSEESLVSHITNKHSTGEYGVDRDIKELNRALPYR
ncbi:hypothetical protein VTK56DRAFT_10173 [Thermocarpiscus australiensis]